jgi:hypothetical protein
MPKNDGKSKKSEPQASSSNAGSGGKGGKGEKKGGFMKAKVRHVLCEKVRSHHLPCI